MVHMGVDQADMAASIAIGVIDKNTAAELDGDSLGTDAYKTALEALRDVQETCGIAYIYTLYTDGKNVYYGVDTDKSSDQAKPGEEFEVSYYELADVFGGQEYVQDYIDSTEDGELISVYKPIKDGAGKVVGVLGCDYDAASVSDKINSLLITTCAITGVSVVAAILVLQFIIGRVVKGLVAVNSTIYDMVNNEGDLTQKLDVKTGDELELIADNVNMLLDYIHSIMLNIAGNSIKLN